MIQENSFGAELGIKYQVRETQRFLSQERLRRQARADSAGFQVSRFLAPIGAVLERGADAFRAWSAGRQGPEPQCC